MCPRSVTPVSDPPILANPIDVADQVVFNAPKTPVPARSQPVPARSQPVPGTGFLFDWERVGTGGNRWERAGTDKKSSPGIVGILPQGWLARQVLSLNVSERGASPKDSVTAGYM